MNRDGELKSVGRPKGREASLSSKSSSSSSSSKSSSSSPDEEQQPKRGPTSKEKTHANSQALTTEVALLKLHEEIKVEVELMRDEFDKRRTIYWLKKSIQFKSELSKMRWPSVLFMAVHVLAHFVVGFALEIENLAIAWVGVQGFILLSLLLMNLAVNLWDTRLRFKELLMRSEQILVLIKSCSKDKQLLKQWKQYCWNSADAKNLFIPKSPCVNQTLTYRDDSCLNLPDFLLVKGDIIHLYPGERAPGDCISLKTVDEFHKTTLGERSKISLVENQIFHTTQLHRTRDATQGNSVEDLDLSKPDDLKSAMVHARLKRSNKGTDFLMLSTPYIKSIRMSLQRSHKRPVNSVEKECFIVSRKYFETFVIPSVFLLSTIVTAIHYGYLDLTDSDQQIKTISIAHLLLRPSLTIMPFLPWMFPCFWLAVNAYGSARLLCCAEAQIKKAKEKAANSNYLNSPTQVGGAPSKFENLLATPTAAGSSENKHDEDDLNDLRVDIRFTSIFMVFLDLIRGKGGYVWRSSSLLQVLGCLTSLCCIDKVGVLSWSNPTPEKVFLLAKSDEANEENRFLVPPTNNISDDTSSQNPIDSSNQPTIMSGDGENLKTQIGNFASSLFNDDKHSTHKSHIQMRHLDVNQPTAEVLDVSQTSNFYRGSGFDCMSPQYHARLQFDDLSWRKYIDNLKPLGLAIILNNCCEESFGDYFRFYKHICYESILRCNLTPVVKRRCICALSSLIGFSKDAVKDYKYVSQIGIYKLIDPTDLRKEKLMANMENTTRLKLPFPNMVCNLHQDVCTGGYQAFSYGTADAILDACVEYWDGKELAPLEQSTRKKIMDFYHRTSLTSYCSAFAYTPLLETHDLVDRYIELPPDNPKLSKPMRRLNNEHQEELLQNQLICLPERSSENSDETRAPGETYLNPNSQDGDDVSQDSRQPSIKSRNNPRITRRHLSMDGIDENLDVGQSKSGKKSRKLNAALEELTDQVFVGMVAMQYQACPDFVGLVEQLEHACIRFVHFSKENELRSRVFSEKMGLESGWNCHISLQSDQDLDKALKSDAGYRTPDNKVPSNLDATKSDTFTPSARVSSVLIGSNWNRENATGGCGDSISSDERTLYSWKSLPSLVMQLTSRLYTSRNESPKTANKHDKSAIQLDSTSNIIETGGSEFGDDREQEEELGEVEKEENFDPLAFDMSNRAKLPKGIENIRPHLETVDNVPLQVSLFTDCTPELTMEMIEIMQDYGEIVCVIGSAASKSNTAIFLQANASIAIEPLMPQCCTGTESDISKPNTSKRRPKTKRPARRRKRRHRSKYHTPQNGAGPDNDEQEFTIIRMEPRVNNPRDRLGIRSHELMPTVSVQNRAKANHSSSSSSSSSSSMTSYSESGSSESELEDITHDDMPMSDDDLLGPNGDSSEVTSHLARELPSPSSLASKLASLPCSYSYNRQDPVNLYGLIMEARHFTFKMKNAFVCMMCFALSISSAQFLASILFLPPMLSSGLTIWLTVVVVPLMSFSLMNTTMDSQVMKIAVGKNLQLKPENITFFVICYLIKFIPSIIVVVFSFGLVIAHSCQLTGFGSSSLGPCWMFTYVKHGNQTTPGRDDEDLLWSSHLLTAQVSAAFLLVLYFVVISSGFVHRSHLMWQRSPTRNHLWVLISLALVVGQLFYNHLVLKINLNSSRVPYEFLSSLPLHIWLISFSWPIIVLSINSFVKRAEVKATTRQQRRARFDFNTKLGMNSPF